MRRVQAYKRATEHRTFGVKFQAKLVKNLITGARRKKKEVK